MSSAKTLIVITGPTAVGKTQLCLDIARHFDIPIINADSRQIFKELSIGTAKPSAEELQQVRHYFVGTLSLQDYYSASLFESQVMALLGTLFQQRDYALMAGGSIMYIDAVCDGIDDIPTIDDETRATMKRRLAEEGLPRLCEEHHNSGVSSSLSFAFMRESFDLTVTALILHMPAISSLV